MTEEAEQETELVSESFEVEVETNADGAGEHESAAPELSETDEDDEEEIVVSIDGESPTPEPEARAPEWVRELRKSHRELQKRNRELEAKLNAAPEAPKVLELSKKPTLEDCDYDSDEFEQKLANWYDEKRSYDEAKLHENAKAQAEADAWQEKLNSYSKAKSALKVRDFDESEAFIQDTFNVTQQGIVLQGSDNPALLIYAIGKSPKKAKELAAISDPVKFAFAIAKLEATQLKVTNRKAAAAPERTITNGGGRLSGSVDSTLDRLREEALKTGDLSKVMAYKRGKKT